VSGLKQTLLAESGALTSYSHRVFSAWDFGLCGKENVRLRQRIILYELQVRLGWLVQAEMRRWPWPATGLPERSEAALSSEEAGLGI
jgi:hypothetical protein